MSAPRPGGSAAPSTRSIRARSPTPTATASATCAGITVAPRPPRRARRRGGLAVARSSPRRWPTSATTSSDYCDVDPTFGTLADFDAADRRVPRARPQGRARLGAEPQLGPAPVVRGLAQRPRRPEARLVRLARRRRRAAGRRTTGTPRSAPCGGRVDVRRARPASTTCTPSCPSSPTSTGTTRRSRRRCTTSLRFWLDRGVDGFRLDASHKIAKDPAAARPRRRAARRHDEDWETIHDRLRGIRRVVDEYADRMIVGEVALQDLHRVVSYLNSPATSCTSRTTSSSCDLPWDAERSAPRSTTSRRSPSGRRWPAWFLANHDLPRVATPLRRRRPRRRRGRGRSR